MLNKLHVLLKDPECSGNIRCFTWAFVCVMVYLSVFLYGFGVFGLYSDVRDIDIRARMELLEGIEDTRIEMRESLKAQRVEFLNHLSAQKAEFESHRHKMFSGRVFTEQNKNNQHSKR